MAYNPNQHHRRSIRLKGYDYSDSGTYFITICTYQRERIFGAIVDGKMQLNEFGQIVTKHWQWLSNQYPYVTLDEWIIMPNHLHGILVVTDTPRRGGSRTAPTDPCCHPPTSDPCCDPPTMSTHPHGILVVTDIPRRGGSRTAPTDPCCDPHTPNPCCDLPTMSNPDPKRKPLGRLIGAFKTVSTKEINQIRNRGGSRTAPISIWQRNYYEHIVRDRTSLQYIRHYIRNNPQSWKEDQLHPDNPSKW